MQSPLEASQNWLPAPPAAGRCERPRLRRRTAKIRPEIPSTNSAVSQNSTGSFGTILGVRFGTSSAMTPCCPTKARPQRARQGGPCNKRYRLHIPPALPTSLPQQSRKQAICSGATSDAIAIFCFRPDQCPDVGSTFIPGPCCLWTADDRLSHPRHIKLQ